MIQLHQNFPPKLWKKFLDYLQALHANKQLDYEPDISIA